MGEFMATDKERLLRVEERSIRLEEMVKSLTRLMTDYMHQQKETETTRAADYNRTLMEVAALRQNFDKLMNTGRGFWTAFALAVTVFGLLVGAVSYYGMKIGLIAADQADKVIR